MRTLEGFRAELLSAIRRGASPAELRDLEFVIRSMFDPPANGHTEEYRARVRAAKNRQAQRRFHCRNKQRELTVKPGDTVLAPDGREVVVERAERKGARGSKTWVRGYYEGDGPDAIGVSFYVDKSSQISVVEASTDLAGTLVVERARTFLGALDRLIDGSVDELTYSKTRKNLEDCLKDK